MNSESIFCAVTAYNEKFLDRMIEDAYAKAHSPENLYFGVFNQKTNGDKFEDFSKYSNVKQIKASYDKPLGVTYGRLSASMLHEGQKYFCQMDSHLLFYKNWDKNLLDDFLLLKKYVDKPILAQSVISHDSSVYNTYDYQSSLVNREIVYPLKLNKRGDTVPDHSRSNEKKFLGKFLEHGLMFACAEFFTESQYIYEVSYDPFIMYLPDQEISALRAFTRGYRFFSSGYSTMSHLTKVKNFSKEEFSNDFFFAFNSNNLKSKDFYRSSYEQSAYAALLGKRIGYYGAPSIEKYHEYMKFLKTKYSDTHRDVYDIILSKYSSYIENNEKVFYQDIF